MGVTNSKKYKDVAFGLSGMDLENGRDGGVEIVGLGLWCVMDVDRELTTGYYACENQEG